jgi:hypothetical protein
MGGHLLHGLRGLGIPEHPMKAHIGPPPTTLAPEQEPAIARTCLRPYRLGSALSSPLCVGSGEPSVVQVGVEKATGGLGGRDRSIAEVADVARCGCLVGVADVAGDIGEVETLF